MAAVGLKVQLSLGDRAFADPGLVELVARALAAHDTPANRIVFQVADTDLGIDTGERGMGHQLADLGCELSLERFSCGYGAFAFLKAQPVAYLSVDGTSVSALQHSSANQQTVTAVVNMAQDLGIRTIGRRVDDEAAMGRLRVLKVDLVEGEFIGPVEPLTWRTHNQAALCEDPRAGRPAQPVLELVRRALDEDTFVTQFEPMVDLATGRILGHELSLRLPTPEGCPTPWTTVLTVAERFGLSTEVDDRLVRRATEVASEGAPVALDVSTASLSDPDLSRRVDRLVLDAQIDPARLTFEIREEGVRSSPVAASSFIHRMRALGCNITIDHVGADVTDLGFLKRLPVNALKVDSGSVGGLASGASDEHVVVAVVQLAHGLGMTAGAQGVSDRETQRLLEDLGVDHAQGVVFGAPAALGAAIAESGRVSTEAAHGD